MRSCLVLFVTTFSVYVRSPPLGLMIVDIPICALEPYKYVHKTQENQSFTFSSLLTLRIWRFKNMKRNLDLGERN